MPIIPIGDSALAARKEWSRRSATINTLVGGTAGTFIVTLQAAILIPLYINHIGPRLYGAWLASGDFLVWMQTFDLGLPTLMTQRMAKAYGQGDHRSVGEWFCTGAVVLAGVAALIAAAGIGIAFPLPGFFGLAGVEADQLRHCFQLASVGAAANLFNNVFVGLSRAVQNTAFMNFTGVVATMASLAVSFWLVLAGFGLWALPLGLTTRALLVLAGSVIFVLREHWEDLKRHFSYSNAIARELAAISPATTLGGLSYSLMTQSDTAIVGMFRGPELATVYNVTRKLMDACRGLIDQVAFASYGGFAHLVTSPDRSRALRVYAEIRSVRLWLAISASAVCMAINGPLVRLWVGEKQYGGAALTILLTLQMIVGGESYLINYLYRAAVSVKIGSLALAAEAAGRLPLAVTLLLWLGLPGLALGAVLAASVSSLIVLRWTIGALSTFAAAPGRIAPHTLLTRAFVFCIGILMCLTVRLGSWSSVVLVACAVGAAAATVLLFTDRNLSAVRLQIRAWLGPRVRLSLGH